MNRPGRTQVRKAVIPAAGLGTRFLPATKALPKEMIPLVDRPAIQHVVEEAAAAGIRDVLVVTGRGKSSIEDHFDRSPELEASLAGSANAEALEAVMAVWQMARLHYLRQGEPKGLGHAVAMARDHVGTEAFAVLLPDDIMDPRAGVLGSMMEAHDRLGGSVLCLMEVPPDEISLYGAARVEDVGPGMVRVLEVVEKPTASEAPSTLAVMGRYLLTPAIFDAMGRVSPGRGGELQLTDGIALVMTDEPVHGVVISAGRYDIGNKLAYLRATVELGLQHPDLGPSFRQFLTDLVREKGIG